MTDDTRACPGCGAEVAPGAKFCGKCGHDLREAAPEPAKPTPRPAKPAGPGRTMMGMRSPAGSGRGPGAEREPEPEREPGAEGARPPEAKVGGVVPHKGTMMGMPAVPVGERAAPPSSTGEAGGKAGSRGADPFAQTPAPEKPPAEEPARAKPPAAKPHTGTMMGMPAVQSPREGATRDPSPPGPPAAPSAKPAPTPTPTPTPIPSAAGAGGPAPKGPDGPTKRTMLGMAGVASQGVPGPAPQTPAAPSPGAPAPSGTGTTEPMPPSEGRGPAPARPGPARFTPASEVAAASSPSSDSVHLPRRGPSLVAIAASAAAVVLLVGGALLIFLLRSGPELTAAVVRTDGGEMLRIGVAGAPEGSRVRFAGEERALEGGEATLPLPADALEVGENELTVQVVDPDGEVDEEEVTLTVDYRVRTELDGLGEDPPAFSVVVQATPGARVSVGGESLELDAEGRGERRVAIDRAAPPSGPEPVYEHGVEYRIDPPEGEPASGTLRTRIPYTALQIERPGREVITDAESVRIAGSTHPQARVTVAGERVEVSDGRFETRHPLPEPGAYEPMVVATRPGQLPRRQTIRIERVEDLEQAAEQYPADPDLSYARLASSPNVHRGRKVELTGRIYNVEVEDGESVLQMLVRDCPAGERCPLWVTYDAATDLGVQAWARVLGEVTGEQQFRAESGKVITVPRVHAKLVLPVKQ